MITVTPVDVTETRTTRIEFDEHGRAVVSYVSYVRTVLASVTGVEPMRHYEGRPGQQWVPVRMRVDYRQGSDGRWAPAVPALTGCVLRRDGSVGKRRALRAYCGWDVDRAPEWVTAFVAAAHPNVVNRPEQVSGMVGSVPVPT